MRVFLDTNVLVAALATRGLCADVLRTVLQSHELVVSEVVLDELERALSRKLRMPAARVAEVRSWLETFLPERAARVGSGRRAEIRLSDAADVRVVRSALAARAELLVTGDKEMLEAALPIPVVSPRAFWDLARAGPPSDEVHER